ncbi:MAG: tRNA (adenosine(37)-N6)-threonylcarbamoyltransferase complex ATPase subunit type 1 TsaE [Candidatus Moranbacteria bacterium CG23_combo_of_CG06-09_8_20_14_all_35_22]|nr:MAG: tRNA (adenosine(37)-N6)-threonylcarbamoyltransferase complex ATPase subunit type 1 TsaE [Candidatus Moranbacteria bacterium CG23_combo_of_CG06-09_8_20_14_all_35_22]
MNKEFITINSKQTKKLGEFLAQELRGGEIICLDGELGAGKTTFTQGLLKGLKIEGPYTSPTFLIMKQYQPHPSPLLIKERGIIRVYHFDAYRVGAQDILNLGFEEILSNPKNIIIIEWAKRIKEIIPADAIRIEFKWLGENKRKIIFKNK